MKIKNPNTISFSILLLILSFAIVATYFLYKEQPTGTIFQMEGSDFAFPYQLQHPDQQVFFPFELQEVSGLAWSGNGQVLAIQDEEGIVFVYDLNRQKVVQKIRFGKDLDYEGIAAVRQQIYVLERDGDIFKIDSLSGETVESKKYETPLTYSHNAEGLEFDPVDSCLLVALKDEIVRGPHPDEGSARVIYSFNLKDNRLSEHPVYFINELELGKLIYQKEKSYSFKPSGVAVHPKSGNIYVISSVGRLLIVINRAGQLLYAERLDPGQFPQPEGIAFDPNGRLMIASEGRGGKGRMSVFYPN